MTACCRGSLRCVTDRANLVTQPALDRGVALAHRADFGEQADDTLLDASHGVGGSEGAV